MKMQRKTRKINYIKVWKEELSLWCKQRNCRKIWAVRHRGAPCLFALIISCVLLIAHGCSEVVDIDGQNEAINSDVPNSVIEVNRNEADNSEEASNQDTVTAPTLGGITLGDSSRNVVNALGNDCTKIDEPDNAGIIGEDMTIWRYESGISVTIGKTSGKVLRIASISPNFKTDLGIKVDDDLNTVYKTYGPLCEETISRHSDEVLEGWFLVGNEAVIIFDFNKSDNTVVNSSITSDSKVEEIIIAYWKHFD